MSFRGIQRIRQLRLAVIGTTLVVGTAVVTAAVTSAPTTTKAAEAVSADHGVAG